MDDRKNDIGKYLKGELSPSEMHALEKRALNDPFLEDALEGSAQIPTESLEADLNMLEATLDQRTKAAKVKPVSVWTWPMRIAAGLLVITISAFVIIRFTGDNRSNDLAQKNDPVSVPKQPEVQPPAATDSVAGQSDNYLSLAKPEAPESSRTQEDAPAEPNEQTENGIAPDKKAEAESVEPSIGSAPAAAAVPKTGKADAAAEMIVEEKIAQATPEQSAQSFKNESVKKSSARESDRNKSKVGAPAPSRAAGDIAANVKVIRGKVRAQDGAGLPGVNVMIKGSNIGTVTDTLGNYQIPVTDGNQDLLFSSIGYLNTEVNASGKDEVDLQMSEDVAQLSEVVVVGYGTSPADDKLTGSLEFASPASGRRAFKQYLEQNLRYPEQAVANNVEGRVTIMFTVETSGQLSDFRVLRGIGNGCDEEVIRLIKEGPEWSPSRRKGGPVRDQVKVRMRFALPENKK